MFEQISFKSIFCAAAIVVAFAVSISGQTTSFTYQGRVTDGGTPANGNYDLQFKLFDNASNGAQIGATQTLNTVSVSGGIFTVILDFGSGVFTGANRYLEISARLSGTSTFTVLSPRQQISAAPYAIRSATTAIADNTTQLNGVPASQYVLTSDARMTDARPPAAGSGNYIQNTSGQQAASNFNISGNGVVNGRIGVGTISPLTKLDVRGNVSIGLTTFAPFFGANALFLANDDGGDTNNYLRVEGSANTLYIIADSQQGASTGAGITFRTGEAGATEADRVRIEPNGNVGIGTTAPVARLHVGGVSSGLAAFFEGPVIINGQLSVQQLGSGSTALCRDSFFALTNCSSSLRYKTDVHPFGAGLELVSHLRPVGFRWKSDGLADFGLIAEEVAAVEPLLVTHNQQGQIEGVKYDRLTVVLINAVGEQQRQITQLRQELARQHQLRSQEQEQLEQVQKQLETLKQLICLDHPEARLCK